jgi:hypothetical protein
MGIGCSRRYSESRVTVPRNRSFQVDATNKERRPGTKLIGAYQLWIRSNRVTGTREPEPKRTALPGFQRLFGPKGVKMPESKKEHHHTGRIGWLRAAVLGANDGILSTSSLLLGVAAAHATHRNLLVAGMAGLVAGAMSMAAGEYVSVHSQADTEHADLNLERLELKETIKANTRSWRQSTSVAGSIPLSPNRWPSN